MLVMFSFMGWICWWMSVQRQRREMYFGANVFITAAIGLMILQVSILDAIHVLPGSLTMLITGMKMYILVYLFRNRYIPVEEIHNMFQVIFIFYVVLTLFIPGVGEIRPEFLVQPEGAPAK